MAGAVARLNVGDPGRALFDEIGAFLTAHRLSFDPFHYAFVHRLLTTPDEALVRAVAALTDGGVRLTDRDVASLSPSQESGPASSDALERAEAMLAQTRSQMADFSGLVDRMRAETKGFGRDLAASVDAIDPILAPEVVGLTVAMLNRVQRAEADLNSATTEAATLRAELAVARDDARIDALTGLGNRRALQEAYAAHVATGTRGCLAVCDIDHFKRINDSFGHAVGDRVLTAIAATLASACAGAQVTRYGGEEFAVLFPGHTVAEASALLDRARATVATKRYRVRDSDLALGMITFSAGVTAIAGAEAFDDAFARADALLYAAKADGRNQVRT